MQFHLGATQIPHTSVNREAVPNGAEKQRRSYLATLYCLSQWVEMTEDHPEQ
jgi:hypothetical protein